MTQTGTPSAQPVLVAEGLSRSTPPGQGRLAAVRAAALRVARQELVAVLGSPSAGTSTLLGLCGGLARPDQGHVLVDGHEVSAMNETDRSAFLKRSVGWVFETPLLVPMLTAEENVALVMHLAGEPDAEVAPLTEAALEAVGLLDRADNLPTELSRGEQQRVALARALVKAPPLVIADQPTAQLDPRTAHDILRLLRDAARGGVAVLFSTQEEAEAERADRIIVMDDGVLGEGPTRT